MPGGWKIPGKAMPGILSIPGGAGEERFLKPLHLCSAQLCKRKRRGDRKLGWGQGNSADRAPPGTKFLSQGFGKTGAVPGGSNTTVSAASREILLFSFLEHGYPTPAFINRNGGCAGIVVFQFCLLFSSLLFFLFLQDSFGEF